MKEENHMDNTNERIGEGLVRIGAISEDQVKEILKLQEQGDNRLFGEIAVDLGYVNIEAIIDYLESRNEDE
ncbi:MAG: hypothetical protein JXB88_11825 [Spirochaetales bacterium]|nr:hypothetical protein [Spirochaetales bacterium]